MKTANLAQAYVFRRKNCESIVFTYLQC